MPTATASTGVRNDAPRALRISSSVMIAMPIRAPMAIMSHGSSPPNMPFETAAISVACGAASGLGLASVAMPMP